MSVNGWLNIYKPKNISSAKAVALVKRFFRWSKVGHTGTLDVEAEGVLPIALGQATKLASILVDAHKRYEFTIKFGSKTDTADSAGKVIETCLHIPTHDECVLACEKFLGKIQQIPPAYSALKIGGQRAYSLARAGRPFALTKRTIEIYSLQCTAYSAEEKTASYICECSKGTYIRTLAEDISLSLQSLGFVLELRRTKVGIFAAETAIDITDYCALPSSKVRMLLQEKCLKMEVVLDDIPVLDASDRQAQEIRFGQLCQFDASHDYENIWVRNNENIVAIGSLHANNFKSSRVFNYNMENKDVDN